MKNSRRRQASSELKIALRPLDLGWLLRGFCKAESVDLYTLYQCVDASCSGSQK
jgi:hypothetical protein